MVIEIVKGGRNKYEVDHGSGKVYLDRYLFTAMGYPADYGFIDGTLGADGDPLDALVLAPAPVYPGVIVRARVVGMMTMSDEAGGDDKVLTVPADRRWDHVTDISDVPSHELDAIAHFFAHYKDLQPAAQVTDSGRWVGAAPAAALIEQATHRHQHGREHPT